MDPVRAVVAPPVDGNHYVGARAQIRLWGARGDVLHVREAVPGRGSQVRGWMTCAALASYLLGRKYWVWTPHGLYKLLREPGVCRVDVSTLLSLDEAKLANASLVIEACDECAPGSPQRRPRAPKSFRMNCGRDLVPGWDTRDAPVQG